MTRTMIAIALALALAAPAAAQVQSGTIYGTIKDEQGGVLPGVTVTLTSADRTHSFVTEANGEYRFLNLPPGTYKVTTELAGFTTMVRDGIVVVVGQNVEIPFSLRLAAVEETVTVSGETPLVDTKTMGTNTNFTQSELEKIPTSRDPWALLRTVPGVLVDRVNIAGNETGQQSNFQSKGTRPQDAVWTMDGVVITDMAAIGSSPTYFNYDNFEEIQVSTSGQDIRQPTGGIGLNLVVKRGTNVFRGGARGYLTGEGLEASNVPDELLAIGVTAETADHNKQISDYGFDLGGPILKDKAWFYASWADQDIRLVRQAGNMIDRTLLKTTHIKGNWQATSKDMISVLWFLGAKEKYGRSTGTTGILFEADTATWNQGGNYVDNRPHGLLKIEANRVVSSRLFVTGRYSYYNTGFGLIPRGGLEMEVGESLITASSYGSTRQAVYLRPQHYLSGDANVFANGLGASHDVKVGVVWRRNDAYSQNLWPGTMIRALENSATDFRARVYREGAGTNRIEQLGLYVGDTISKGRLTLDLGFRYDRQSGKALPSDTQSNAAFPNLVPGISFSGYEAPFTWNNFSPRAGATFAIGDQRKTILRASFSRYAGQLETGIVGFMNPSGSLGFADYRWVDRNADHFAQPDEVLTSLGAITFGGGFDPANPTSVRSADQIDPDLKAPVTTSVVAGVERELMANLALQANYSYTRTSNYSGYIQSVYYSPFDGLSPSDFLRGTVITGTIPGGESYSVQTYYPDPAKVAANGNSRILTNYPGYRSYYHGLELQVIKRMSNRWMARAGFAWLNPLETYGDSPVNLYGNPTPTDQTPLINGGPFALRSGGSGSGDFFMHGTWQFSAGGMYLLPYDIELGASVLGRQGYPFPVYRSVSLGLDGSWRVLVTPEVDTYRLDNLWNTDLRFARTFKLERVNLSVMGDLFNVFNANTELVRNRNVTSSTYRRLAQNLSPRILRFGLKLEF
jgi:hypothetical protein